MLENKGCVKAVVRGWTDLPTKSVAEAAVFLADGFQSLDKEGNVIMNKETWSGFYGMLLAAFADYRSPIMSEV